MFGLIGCDKLGGASLSSDESKYSYAIGYQFARNMKDQQVEINPGALAMAIEDVMKDKKTQLTEEEMQTAMKTMYEKRKAKEEASAVENKKAGDDYLTANKGKDGIKTTESGLQYKVETEGEGAPPKEDSVVTVHYKGTLIDGKEFDSSYGRGQPATFPVNGVIAGWQEALKMMKKGAKWKLYIPPDLAYGERARPGIPANSVLVFDVELLDVATADQHKKKMEEEMKAMKKAEAKDAKAPADKGEKTETK
jgi:FKBP-type peptidyl-prolyl cis-trans isomerase FkpA/FKBP-type peptidyl-prolyl cis-trans isomerase FklB